jgi:ATP-dependent NAD(P)H-hydrate dehydratase
MASGHLASLPALLKNHALYAAVSALVPKLETLQSSVRESPTNTKPNYKGQHGKVLVIGGSFEYTGAPYYAGMAALKAGADLATVVCTKGAAIPIKAYSPELIVHPLLPTEEDSNHSAIAVALERLHPVLERSDAVVIGPGLGRDTTTLATIAQLLPVLADKGLPVVLDGDALYLIACWPDLLSTSAGKHDIVLTPNAMEFTRLWNGVHGFPPSDPAVYGKSSGGSGRAESSDSAPSMPENKTEAVTLLLAKLRNKSIVLLLKGPEDGISTWAATGGVQASVHGIGSPRRCGGQGDVLAGTLGTFLSWARKSSHGKATYDTAASGEDESCNTAAAAAFGAAVLTRKSAEIAYSSHHRSTTTPDIIASIGQAFDACFPPELA